MYSAIESAKKGHQIFCPTEWPTILRGARRKRPYALVELQHGDFFDLKDLKEKTIIGRMSKDAEGEPLSWMKIKRLKFEKNADHIKVKESYAQPTYRILPIVEPSTRRSKQVLVGHTNLRGSTAAASLSVRTKRTIC